MPRSLLARLALAPLAPLAALTLAACQGSAAPTLDSVVLTEDAVPQDWAAADFDETQERALRDLLPRILGSNSEARLVLRAFENETGTQGAAVILIETAETAAVPQEISGQRVVAPLAELLVQQEALLGPDVGGGDPGTYFALSDEPVAGSLRSRLVRLRDDDRLFFDSLAFPSGRVLAVVTVWYPEREGPFRDIEALAEDVALRLKDYLGEA